MKIEIIPCLSDNYSYLIIDKKTNIIAIVDPAEFSVCDKFIKKYKKLDYILNTHHHLDHVDGNLDLKQKYNAKILGFEEDKDRIPGIDILLKKNQNFSIGNFEFKVLFVPGHTSGHIAFYFEKENVVFTGDTLFSLGCGRVFEGTNIEMFESLKLLKNLPSKTNLYCGHEYTKKNLEFCLMYDSKNQFLKKKQNLIESNLKNNLPTIPSSIEDEKRTNIFLRCGDLELKKALDLLNGTDQEIFNKLRGLKDTF